MLLLRGIAPAEFVLSPNVPAYPGGGPGPFLVTSDLASSYRLQEVHGANDFGVVSSLPVFITQLSFARVNSGAPVDVNLQNVEIRLSTTMKNPDGLSPTFAQNVGVDETLVFTGPLHFYDTGVEQFGIHIQLQQPFLFDYHIGNLLIDVRNYTTIAPPPSGRYTLMGDLTVGDSVSGVGAINVNAASGTFGTFGLLTRFTVTPIPEPSSWTLLAAAGVGFIIVRRRCSLGRKKRILT